MKVEMDERPETPQTLDGADRRPSGSMAARIFLRTLIVLITLGAVAWLVTSGIRAREESRKVLQTETQDRATRTVSVVHPKQAAPVQEITLPANIQAFAEAPIYARTNGYLKRWTADIGARVKAGELLAEIDTPELSQQIQQARADLATAEANLRLAELTAARYAELFKASIASRQDADNASGNLDARKTAVDSAQFNVKRLEETQSFNKIYAPFDGLITARNIDVGSLIDSGSAGGPAKELFHLVATQKLRVFVSVPQTYSRAAKLGMTVDITLPELPGRRFQGILTRSTNAIDPSTRTLLTQIDVDNSSNEILPGSFGEAHLRLPSPAAAFLIPANALLFRSEGTQVAEVQEGSRILLVSVKLGRDFGTELEVVSGLSGDESIVVNPPDNLVTGQPVLVASPEASAKKK
jgi:RND family efflux transporter MFP subunit